MKIGIITFHWAVNYGAVLQSFALQKYLTDEGYEVQVIDYVPYTVKIKQSLKAIKKREYSYFRKDRLLATFRKQWINMTKHKYFSHACLTREHFDFDCIIAGSDQIWNDSFTLRGEGKTTLSYFLDFAPSDVKRIAYAASFGFHTPTEEYIDAVKNEISKFSSISVRESDGVEIVAAFNLKSSVVCDPTALLTKEDYLKIIKNKTDCETAVFAYILRNDQHEAWKTARYVGNEYNVEIQEEKFEGSMEEWIASILNAGIVVTNSFHGVMLSLIMRTPFIAVTIEGSGMNSRISTLLEKVGLQSRLIDYFSEDTVKRIISEEIEWKSVGEKMNGLRNTGIEFLTQVLK